MKRCQSSKVVIYRSDGTGRDTFIEKFNGGFQSQALLLQNSPSPLQNPVNSHWKVGFKKVKQFYEANNNYVKYHSDGTGRDTYIQRDNGGLYNFYVTGSGFLRSLRKKDQKQPSIKPRGQFSRRLQERAKKQRVQSARLSQPKISSQKSCCNWWQ